MSTLGWLGMRFVCELGYASFGPLNTLVLSKMADDAHSTEWQERHHLLILFVIFAVEWYMIDWIKIISEQSARQDFQYKLRSQLFNMMRQDKASLDKNGYRRRGRARGRSRAALPAASHLRQLLGHDRPGERALLQVPGHAAARGRHGARWRSRHHRHAEARAVETAS